MTPACVRTPLPQNAFHAAPQLEAAVGLAVGAVRRLADMPPSPAASHAQPSTRSALLRRNHASSLRRLHGVRLESGDTSEDLHRLQRALLGGLAIADVNFHDGFLYSGQMYVKGIGLVVRFARRTASATTTPCP